MTDNKEIATLEKPSREFTRDRRPQEPEVIDFDAIRLRLASPEIIRGWSYGEITLSLIHI